MMTWTFSLTTLPSSSVDPLGVMCVGDGGRLTPSWVARAPWWTGSFGSPLLGQVCLVAVEDPLSRYGWPSWPPQMTSEDECPWWWVFGQVQACSSYGTNTHRSSWLPGLCNMGLSSAVFLDPFCHLACHFEVCCLDISCVSEVSDWTGQNLLALPAAE